MIVNANSRVQPVIQIRNGIMKHVNVSVKVIVHAKKTIVGILAHVFVRTISDTSVITCDEIISVMDIVSTKMTNTVSTNASVNSHIKKVRYKIESYILHAVLLVIMFLLIITIICYHYAKHRSKQKSLDALTI